MSPDDLILLAIACFLGGLFATLLICALILGARVEKPRRDRTCACCRSYDTDDLPASLRRQGF